MKNEKTLVEKTLDIYNMTLPDFANKIGIKKTTLDTWKNEKISPMGELLLNILIENHELKKKDEAIKHLFSLYDLAKE
jgi:DNA-binding transcriptional regulator YiaG